jgi:hypothetical protein
MKFTLKKIPFIIWVPHGCTCFLNIISLSITQSVKDSLFNGCNVPTVLQSLGQIARYSPPAFDKHEKELVLFIRNKVIISDEVILVSDVILSLVLVDFMNHE